MDREVKFNGVRICFTIRQSARIETSTVMNATSCALRYLGYCLYECGVKAPTIFQASRSGKCVYQR